MIDGIHHAEDREHHIGTRIWNRELSEITEQPLNVHPRQACPLLSNLDEDGFDVDGRYDRPDLSSHQRSISGSRCKIEHPYSWANGTDCYSR
jgi:hypothetical protein